MKTARTDIQLAKDVLLKNYIKPNIYLCEVDKTRICKLETTNTKASFKFNSYSEISFEVARIYNDIITGETKVFPFYDKIEALRLIYVENIGYFEIQGPSISGDGIKESKSITAYSLEYTLSQKYLEDLYNDGTVGSIEAGYIDEVYKGELPAGTTYPVITLYNEKEPRLSLLHLILEKIYGWKIGHVDDSLKTKSRQFNIDRTSVYDFIMNDICEMFNCYVVFNTIENTINLYAEALTDRFQVLDDNVTEFTLKTPFQTIATVSDDGYKTTKYKYNSSTGVLTFDKAPAKGHMIEVISEDMTQWETDVFVSFDNLSQEVNVDYSADDIKTVLTVEYGDNQNIREVNLGMPYITDLSYYYSVDWMGQELHDAYQEYNKACDAEKANYTKNVQDRLELASQLDFEENRTSLTYALMHNVNHETVGTYYVRTGDAPNYTYVEKNLPDDYQAGTTYFKNDGVNLTETNIVNFRKALGAYFHDDSMDELDKLVEQFEFTKDNALPFGDKSYKKGTLLYILNKHKSRGAFIPSDQEEDDRNPEDMYENMDIYSDGAKERDAAIKQFLGEVLDQFGTNMLGVIKDMYLKAQEGFIGGWNAADDAVKEEESDGKDKDDELTDEEIEAIEKEIKDSATDYPNYYPIVLILEVINEEIGTSIYSTPPAPTSTGRYADYVRGDKHYDGIDTLKTKINEKIEANAKITESLNMNTWFKANYKDNWEQLLMRLSAFLREDELVLSDIVSTELDTIVESLSVQEDALSAGYLELQKLSQPKLNFSMTMANIYALPEFARMIPQFQLGNLIKVAIRPGYIKQARLMQVDMGLDDFSDFSCEFGELTSLRTQSDIHADLMSQAVSAGKQVATYSSYWTKGSDTATATDLKIQQGLLDAATEIKAIDATQAVSIDRYGIHMRKENPANASGFDDKQGWIVNNQFLYSDDAFKTVKSVFGEYKISGQSYWGLLAEAVLAGYIEGSQIIGGQLYSLNYQPDPPKGTRINLETGDFEIGGGRFVYNSATNDLTLSGVTIDWESSTTPEISDISGLNPYLSQLDGRIQSYSQEKDPSEDWQSEEDKNKHKGDLWFNPKNGLTKRWTGTGWEDITDEELKKLAESKAQIFTSTPTTPYYVGDLWVQGSEGDIMNCIKERLTGSYVASDWEKSSKYTDDTTAKEALKEAKQALKDAAQGIDLAKEAEKNAKNYTDAQNGSLQSTLTSAYENYANSKVKTLDDAVGKYLGLSGSTTQIGSNYMVSPYIGGGYLNISGSKYRVIVDPKNHSQTNFIFQIYNLTDEKAIMGIDTAGNGYFNGTVHATNLTLGSGVTISTNNIDGIDNYATTDSVSKVEAKIPTSVTDLGFKTENIVYKGDVKQTEKTDSNGIKYLETSVPSSSGTVTYSTYDAKDYIVFGRSKGTNSSGNNYVCISKEGLLTARNALIYGTIYATNGEFIGKITANTGEIGGFNISSTNLWNGINSFSSTVDDDDDTGTTTGGAKGVYIGTDGIRLGSDLKLYANGTIAAGKRVYLPNGRGLRGMKNGQTTASFSNSLCIAYVSEKNNIVLGHASNAIFNSKGEVTTAYHTYVRSAGSTYLACNGIDVTESRYVFEVGAYTNTGDNTDRGTFRPALKTEDQNKSNYFTDLGSPNYRWHTVFTQNIRYTGTVDQGSDRRLKKNITSIQASKYIDFFDKLHPVSFNMRDSNVYGSKTRLGFVAQEVEEALEQSGLTNEDFIGLNKDGEYYSLAYSEFIALNTAKIKQLEQKLNQALEVIDKQQAVIEELKNKIL